MHPNKKSPFCRLALAVLTLLAAPATSVAQRVSTSQYDIWIGSYATGRVQQRAANADLDGDGLSNAAERLLMLDPTVPLGRDPNRHNAPSIGLGPRGERVLRYRVDPDIEGEITHEVQTTTDFRDWQTARPENDRGVMTAALDPGRGGRSFARVIFSHNPPDNSLPTATFSARSEETLGLYDTNGVWGLTNAADGQWRGSYRQRWTNLRGGAWRKMASNFLVEGDGVPVSILFSGEAYVEQQDRRMFVRLLVDGQRMKPGDVVFANGGSSEEQAARSMEFTGIYDRGLHTVEAQWMIDGGAAGFMRDAALLIRQGNIDHSRGALLGVTPDSGANIETDSVAWSDVPGLQEEIQTHDSRDCLTATVSAESYSTGGEEVWVRVLIDGAEADPGEVLFSSDGLEGTRAMVFGSGDLNTGSHDVRVQWRAGGNGGEAGLGDRTLTLSVGNNGNDQHARRYFLAEDNAVAIPKAFAAVPGLSQAIVFSPDSDLSVIFGIEFPSPPQVPVHARLSIAGTPVPESEMLLTDGDTAAGVYSFSFDAKHIAAGGFALFTTVAVEWMADAEDGPVAAARSMVLYVKDHDVPDLAEPPKNGLGIVGGLSLGVEPMFGKRHVLFILWDPNRLTHPAPTINALEDAAFGNSDSIADYFAEMSDDRIQFENAGVLGPYAADNPWGFYWNGPGNHQDKYQEAIDKADDDFDFSDYDFNGDGFLSEWNELAVVVVVPQNGSSGGVEYLWAGETPQTFDGVYIDRITEWYAGSPIDYTLCAHELSHQILFAGDLYAKSGGSNTATRPGDYCLLDADNSYNTTSHINPAWKLALGWVTPRILHSDGAQSLGDVKTTREIIILPREPSTTSNDEYVILENRPAPANNARYDFPQFDSGIAVWHIIENPTDAALVPPCDLGNWVAQTNGDLGRAGIRLIRPRIFYQPNFDNTVWSSDNYDLDAFGLSCPPPSDDAHNILRWADGTPSWSVRNWSAAGPVMTFNVFTP